MTRSLQIPRWAGTLILLASVVAVAWPAFPRAAFVPDDYRYLAFLREIDAGVGDAWLRSTIVENRWDQDWWIPDGTFVRFFRPLVIASYALDRAVFGESDLGFVIGNVVLHGLVVLLVWACLRRLLRGEGPALLGAFAYATQACHAEQLSYVAGRTDTLAALFFFAGLALFLRGRGDGGRAPGGPTWAIGVAGLYFLALLVKEYSVLLPLFFVLADRWSGDPDPPSLARAVRRRAFLYGACAVAAIGFFVLRAVVLGAEGSGVKPFPYFHLPDRPGFVAHAIGTSIQYAVSVVSGLPCGTFLTSTTELHDNLERLFEYPPIAFLGGTATLWIVLSVAVGVAILGWGLRSPRGRFLSAFFLILLVPMVPLYSTGRYLYLPTFGWCGLIGLGAGVLWAAQRRALAVAFAVLLVVPQAVQCPFILSFPPRRPPGQSQVDRAEALIRDSQLDLTSGGPIYLVDAPMPWILIQFLQVIVDVRLPHAPPVRVLCKAPHDLATGATEITRVDEHTIELRRPRGALYQPAPNGSDFDQRVVAVGDTIGEGDYEVTVLGVLEGRAQHVRVRFERPLAELQLARCARQANGAFRATVVR